jgi:hypothetical protein
MRKEFNMMLIVVVCAILGIVCAGLINTLYEQGIITTAMIGETFTMQQFQFLIFFAWLVIGIVIGVMKD